MTALAALKAHLNIIGEHDDELLTSKLDAAIMHTAGHVESDDPITWDTAPADVRQAILMLAGHWYENREATLVGVPASVLPLGYHDLLLPYRRWIF